MNAITREEKIISGENLTPITRKEMFLAKAAGMDVETPEPITREEMFLSKITGGGSGGGDSGGGDFICETGTFTPASDITEIQFEFKDGTAYYKSTIFMVVERDGLSYSSDGLAIYEATTSSRNPNQSYINIIYGKGSALKSYRSELRSGRFGELVKTNTASDVCEYFTLSIPATFPYNSGGCVFKGGITYTYAFIKT